MASTDLSVVRAKTVTMGGSRPTRGPRRSSRIAGREHSDSLLIDRWITGDADAMAELYERHAPALHAYALRIAGFADAADVVQDTMIHASARIGQLRDPASLRPWLFAIARSQIYSRSRARSARCQAPEDFSAIVDPTLDPAERAVQGDEQRMMWEAADGLAARDRRLLELCVLDGLSGVQLAAAMGVEVGHLYVLVHRMRARLGRCVTALLIARRRRRDCGELARVSDPAAGFNPQMRKRIERHLTDCDGCRNIRWFVEHDELLDTSLAG